MKIKIIVAASALTLAGLSPAVRAQTTGFDKAAAEDLDRVFGRGRFAAA